MPDPSCVCPAWLVKCASDLGLLVTGMPVTDMSLPGDRDGSVPSLESPSGDGCSIPYME